VNASLVRTDRSSNIASFQFTGTTASISAVLTF